MEDVRAKPESRSARMSCADASPTQVITAKAITRVCFKHINRLHDIKANLTAYLLNSGTKRRSTAGQLTCGPVFFIGRTQHTQKTVVSILHYRFCVTVWFGPSSVCGRQNQGNLWDGPLQHRCLQALGTTSVCFAASSEHSIAGKSRQNWTQDRIQSS